LRKECGKKRTYTPYAPRPVASFISFGSILGESTLKQMEITPPKIITFKFKRKRKKRRKKEV